MAPKSRVHKLHLLLLADPRYAIPGVLLVESVGIRDSWGSAATTIILPVLGSILVSLRFFLAKSLCHQSGYPWSLKQVSHVCLEFPQWEHFKPSICCFEFGPVGLDLLSTRTLSFPNGLGLIFSPLEASPTLIPSSEPFPITVCHTISRRTHL